MNKNFALLLLFLSWNILSLIAQDRPITWGEVPDEDLEMTNYAPEPTSSAVILADYGQARISLTSGQFKVKYVYHKRIKIFDKKGFEEADISIPFYSSNDNIIRVEAQTIVLEDGKPKIYKLKKTDFFEEKVSDYVSKINFTFPSLKEGAIIEYKYVMASNALSVIDTWYFQGELPRRWSEFRFEIPHFLEYVMFAKKDTDFFIKDSKETSVNLGEMNREEPGEKFRYVMKEVPSMKEESYVTTMDDYLASVEFQLAAFEPLNPSESRQEYMTTWEDFHKRLNKREFFGSQLSEKFRSKDLLKLAKTAVDGMTDKEKILKKVYALVTNKIKWNGRLSLYTSDNINTVLENGQGNASSINIGLINCLRELDMEAYPVLLSTRKHGTVFENYPIATQFNHTIAYVNTGEKEYLIDATDHNKPFNLLPVMDLNQKGLMMKDGEISWVGIKPLFSKSGYSVICSLQDGMLKGSATAGHQNYAAYEKRKEYLKEGEEEYLNNLLKDNTDFTVTNATFENAKDPNQKFSETIDFEAEDIMSADVVYLNPILFDQMTENPFKTKERNYNVDIPYPISDTYLFKLIVPEGYQVEELPLGVSVNLLEGAGSFNYQAKEVDGTIQFMSKIYLKQTLYKPEEYKELKAFFDTIIEKHAEQIVLKKE